VINTIFGAFARGPRIVAPGRGTGGHLYASERRAPTIYCHTGVVVVVVVVVNSSSKAMTSQVRRQRLTSRQKSLLEHALMLHADERAEPSMTLFVTLARASDLSLGQVMTWWWANAKSRHVDAPTPIDGMTQWLVEY
jgi:hypothetical protein